MNTTSAPPAHLLLAEAVSSVLVGVSPQLQLTDDQRAQAYGVLTERMSLALQNYIAAAKAAQGTDFAALVNATMEQIDAGDTEKAKRFLATLVNVVDFAPVVDIPIFEPPKFEPTHRHADGGEYQLLEPMPGRPFQGGGWDHPLDGCAPLGRPLHADRGEARCGLIQTS